MAPEAAGAVLALLIFGLWTYTETHSVMGSVAYEAKRAGDSATELHTSLLSDNLRYRNEIYEEIGQRVLSLRNFAPTPLYELCFADDRLAAKAIVK